ncbi:MAG: hypothetical protein U0350_14060 [Caldilineaceae bacterium]
MKRRYGTLNIRLALVWWLAILMTGTPQVQAQTTPNAPTAPNTIYLPLIAGGAGVTKSKSGIHLGNRGSDWQAAFLPRIQPPPIGAADGQWPAAVVIQSDQVYDLNRATAGRCWVNGASVKQANGQNYAIYDYLTRAITHTLVIIRITPSPGNFSDYANPGGAHNLLKGDTPAGGDYCGSDQSQKANKYRDIRDLAAEMDAIYQVNRAHGWPLDRFYFEPANEPNVEWYPQQANVAPKADNKQAWIDMDDYFAALYDLAKQSNPQLQILAPSMSQGAHGEHYALGTCDNTNMTVVGGNGRTGLDFMKKISGYDIGIDSYTTPKADGFAWHN